MKRITLPDLTFYARVQDSEGNVASEPITAMQQLYRIVAFPPQEKLLSIDEIRTRLPLCDKLAKAKRTLTLEDAEHKLLVAAFSQSRWGGATKEIVALADAVEDAETVDVEARPNRAQRRRAAKEKP